MLAKNILQHPAIGRRRGIARALFAASLGFMASLAGAAERGRPTQVLLQQGCEVVELRRTGENHLFVFGRVNGRRRSCLVDTGWSYATVSTNTAARLTPPRVVERLKLGRVVLTNEPVVIQDMRINGRPAPYDVVLGCDFLLRHHAVIDCASGRLHLRREPPSPELSAEFESRLRAAGWVGIELKRHQPLALTCEVRIHGHAVDMLVDTGAMWSCLDTQTAHALGLRSTPSPHRIRGAGALGQREMSVADLKRVEIGNCAMQNLSVAVFSLTDWGLGAEGRSLQGVGGILGGSELAAAGAVLDCHRLRLWLRPAH